MEANYELREADPSADPSTHQGQRQVFLRHGMYRVVHTTCKCLISFLENIRLLRGPQSSETHEEGSEGHTEGSS